MLKHGANLSYERRQVQFWKGRKRYVWNCSAPACSVDSGQQPGEPAEPRIISALQMKRAVSKGCSSYLVMVTVQKEDRPNADEHAFDKDVKVNLSEYADRFPTDLPALSLDNPRPQVQHTIPLQADAQPPFKPIYRLSPLEMAQVDKDVKEMLAKGYIEPSRSPYGAPILFVQKKDGTLRMVIDYRALNKLTVKNRYPLPRIDDLLGNLQGASIFSSLDLMSGYHQIQISDEDVPKTAFRTAMGLFQWRLLSFGLTNAPATFQAVMNNVFGHLLGRSVLVYLDDILIFSKTPEEHLQHLREVLQILRDANLYAKLSKCTFGTHELEFLGHIISKDGLKVDPKKTAAVTSWPVPKDVSHVRSFLGLANYFEKFIRNYAMMVTPLTDLTRKDRAWLWTPECQKAFEAVKAALSTAPVLSLPDFTKPFEMVCDASRFGLGAVLYQEGKPVAFESRKLSPAERNYTTSEQELLAVIHALRTWRCYLEGAMEFVVVTDHQPNTFLENNRHCLAGKLDGRSSCLGFTSNGPIDPGHATLLTH